MGNAFVRARLWLWAPDLEKRPERNRTDLRIDLEKLPERNRPDLEIGLSSARYFINSIAYVAAGGGKVDIPLPINPWKILGLNSDASRDAVKAAFKNKTAQPSRQNRVMVSVANHILTSTTARYYRRRGTDNFLVEDWDVFVLAACGNTEQLNFSITQEKLLAETDEHGRTLLYIASKSGFYDMCKLLLEKGAPIDKCQVNGSTPLHAASYFGHTLIVGLLLECGAKTDIKNKFGHTAQEESASGEIRSLIENSSSDVISSLVAELREMKLVRSVQLKEFQGEVIAREMVREPHSRDPTTRVKWENIQNTWEPTWHGTRFKHLKSIMKKGLVPSGSRGIKPSEGHIGLDIELFGVKNWAAAIFISPSILYAGHAVYSERVVSEHQQWCVLVKTRCKPGSYKAYNPTVGGGYVPVNGEPQISEYRVPVVEKDKNVVLRVESARNVVVQSLMFVRLSFFEKANSNFEKAMEVLNN